MENIKISANLIKSFIEENKTKGNQTKVRRVEFTEQELDDIQLTISMDMKNSTFTKTTTDTVSTEINDNTSDSDTNTVDNNEEKIESEQPEPIIKGGDEEVAEKLNNILVQLREKGYTKMDKHKQVTNQRIFEKPIVLKRDRIKENIQKVISDECINQDNKPIWTNRVVPKSMRYNQITKVEHIINQPLVDAYGIEFKGVTQKSVEVFASTETILYEIGEIGDLTVTSKPTNTPQSKPLDPHQQPHPLDPQQPEPQQPAEEELIEPTSELEPQQPIIEEELIEPTSELEPQQPIIEEELIEPQPLEQQLLEPQPVEPQPLDQQLLEPQPVEEEEKMIEPQQPEPQPSIEEELIEPQPLEQPTIEEELIKPTSELESQQPEPQPIIEEELIEQPIIEPQSIEQEPFAQSSPQKEDTNDVESAVFGFTDIVSSAEEVFAPIVEGSNHLEEPVEDVDITNIEVDVQSSNDVKVDAKPRKKRKPRGRNKNKNIEHTQQSEMLDSERDKNLETISNTFIKRQPISIPKTFKFSKLSSNMSKYGLGEFVVILPKVEDKDFVLYTSKYRDFDTKVSSAVFTFNNFESDNDVCTEFEEYLSDCHIVGYDIKLLITTLAELGIEVFDEQRRFFDIKQIATKLRTFTSMFHTFSIEELCVLYNLKVPLDSQPTAVVESMSEIYTALVDDIIIER